MANKQQPPKGGVSQFLYNWLTGNGNDMSHEEAAKLAQRGADKRTLSERLTGCRNNTIDNNVKDTRK